MDHIVFDHDSEESTSSGCESGWTLYLQHSIPHDNYNVLHDQDHDEKDYDDDDNDNEDDNMSMVSDASSGPPHFQPEHEEDEYCNMNNNNDVFCDPTLVSGCRKRRKIIEQNCFHSHLAAVSNFADDTASSPFFNFYNKDLLVCNKEASMLDDDSSDYSQGHSTTYFETSGLYVRETGMDVWMQ
uniref:protein SOB FIVE-LIKE 5-like n=1 Tax=Erigeron canadensis TaxID=72917 RepID=UPI001CB8A1C2|nr:protein SOB FIVE-LIKE 5-like [Erigeron canadensis]